jgi:hypothetical protein
MVREPHPSARKRRDVPDDDHVVRYCNSQRVIRNQETGVVTGVHFAAFELRTEKQEEYLSLIWFEFFPGSDHERYKSVKAALEARRPAPLHPKSALAKLKAGSIVATGRQRKHSLRIRDRSSAKQPGYASIEGLPKDNSDADLLESLVADCCTEIISVGEIGSPPAQ